MEAAKPESERLYGAGPLARVICIFNRSKFFVFVFCILYLQPFQKFCICILALVSSTTEEEDHRLNQILCISFVSINWNQVQSLSTIVSN